MDYDAEQRMLDELCRDEPPDAIRVGTIPKEPQMQPHIRWMIRRDMAEVLQIESLTEAPMPWGEEQFVLTLRQRNVIGMVLETNDRVHGFMLYELHKDRLHLLKLVVHPWWRRFGYGRAMIDKLKGKLGLGRRRQLRLEVRESNLDALVFLRSQGFRAVNILRDYYETEDGYLMQYTLPKEAKCQP